MSVHHAHDSPRDHHKILALRAQLLGSVQGGEDVPGGDRVLLVVHDGPDRGGPASVHSALRKASGTLYLQQKSIHTDMPLS